MKKVAIVGYTPTRVDAPYGDESWEIWGLNDLYRFKDEVRRWTRWFDMHQDTPSPTGRLSLSEKVEEFARWECRIYMQEKHPSVPCSVKYPLNEIIDEFGNYFTNSISYMIALAIYEGFDEIGVWGVDMATDSEYGHQRPSCEYFLGIAVGKGIKVYVHPAADLLKTKTLYGYETHKEDVYTHKIKNMVKKMSADKAQAEHQMLQAQKTVWQYDGAISMARQIEKVWRGC